MTTTNHSFSPGIYSKERREEKKMLMQNVCLSHKFTKRELTIYDQALKKFQKKKRSSKYFGTYVLTSELRTCMLWLFCSVGGTTWGKKKKDQLMSSPNKRRRHQDQNLSHLFQAYILRCNLKTSLLLNNWWLCFLIKFITVCCHSDT